MLDKFGLEMDSKSQETKITGIGAKRKLTRSRVPRNKVRFGTKKKRKIQTVSTDDMTSHLEEIGAPEIDGLPEPEIKQEVEAKPKKKRGTLSPLENGVNLHDYLFECERKVY